MDWDCRQVDVANWNEMKSKSENDSNKSISVRVHTQKKKLFPICFILLSRSAFCAPYIQFTSSLSSFSRSWRSHFVRSFVRSLIHSYEWELFHYHWFSTELFSIVYSIFLYLCHLSYYYCSETLLIVRVFFNLTV